MPVMVKVVWLSFVSDEDTGFFLYTFRLAINHIATVIYFAGDATLSLRSKTQNSLTLKFPRLLDLEFGSVR